MNEDLKLGFKLIGVLIGFGCCMYVVVGVFSGWL